MENRLFTIEPDRHSAKALKALLKQHPEVAFVSMVGLDLSGRDTDEKIPMTLFLKDIESFLQKGVQTDGSSVVLPGICSLDNGRVDLIPDCSVNWYVDYNQQTGAGTLRIPANLFHNGKTPVGSRHMLREAQRTFCEGVKAVLQAHPYAVKGLGIDDPAAIDDVVLTGATELEFWVQTPEDQANREQLHTSQELKEQYWQRTRGPVRSALEETLLFLDQYGIGVEMGHKEVGGIAAKLGASGTYDHIMEQLEIDWHYASPMQAADNELLVRHTVKDIFRKYGLEVTFMAKPIRGVAGNGEHHHLGASLICKGKAYNLFAQQGTYLSPVGYGALMGLLKNYAAINAFVACTNDTLNRLKPGFEAPVCVAASLGRSEQEPSRNRTVLVGVVRELETTKSTRFELRSPSPHSNSYLVFASAYLAMLHGIEAAMGAEKSGEELLQSLSKEAGAEDFYLEKDRAYRAEANLFDLSSDRRSRLYGKAPATVWETICASRADSQCLTRCSAFTDEALESYRAAILEQWKTELQNRIVPGIRKVVQECVKKHTGGSTLDDRRWNEIESIRRPLGQSTDIRKCLLDSICDALNRGDFAAASEMQKAAQDQAERLEELYSAYERNLL